FYRKTVRFYPAVATTLADRFVDKDASVGIWIGIAFATPAFVGRAGLIVDQNGRALRISHFQLYLIERVAMEYVGVANQADSFVFFRFIADDHDAGRAFGVQLGIDLRHRQCAIHGLSARHGNCIVV